MRSHLDRNCEAIPSLIPNTQYLNPSSRHRRRAGFTLIEILITMTIMTLLFVATGTAFDAAFKNYDANTTMNTINTTHRNINHQFTAAIRSSYNDPEDFLISVSSDGNTLNFTDSSKRDITYLYIANDKTLSAIIDSGAPAVILENVEPINSTTDIFSLSYPPVSEGFPAGTVSKVSMNFKTSYSDMTKNISIAAVPRNVVFSR